MKKKGNRAAVIFVIQRPDARGFAPHGEADPDFAAALKRAAVAGVEVLAYSCRVSISEIAIAHKVPVYLEEADAV